MACAVAPMSPPCGRNSTAAKSSIGLRRALRLTSVAPRLTTASLIRTPRTLLLALRSSPIATIVPAASTDVSRPGRCTLPKLSRSAASTAPQTDPTLASRCGVPSHDASRASA